MEYIADSLVTGLRSFTQQAIVKLPSRKFLAGVVAYAPAPLRYKYVPLVSFRMFWPTLMCISLVAGCRMGQFVKQEGIALENHVISVVTADHPVKCKQDCLDTPLCFSINVHAQTLPSGWVKCDLNNSTRAANPENLVQRAGYWYHQMTEVEHCTADRCIYKDAFPDGWFLFDSKKLKIFLERKTWGRARKYCQSIGGDLLSISDVEKNEFVSLLMERLLPNASAGFNSSDIVAHWTLDGTDSDVNLKNGAIYKEEDGFPSMYLSGSGEYATTPAVDFGISSFTIASSVKMPSPVSNPSPLFSDWHGDIKFLFYALLHGNVSFFGYDNLGKHNPDLSAGSPPVDKWFHLAVAWDQTVNEAYILLNGSKIGTEPQTAGTYLRNNSHSSYDIGLKRDGPTYMRGYIRDLMIIGRAVTVEEIANITDPNNEPYGGVWIGLNDVVTEGSFHWSDGSQLTYSKWATGQPDNKNSYQNCVEMAVHGGNWMDTSCGRQLPFICQKDV